MRGAKMLAPLPAILAAAAGMRRRDRDPVAGLHSRHAGPYGLDDAGRLVPRNQRLAHDEAAVAALEVIVEIGSADASCAEPQQHLARSGRRRVGGFDAEIFLGVNAAGEHGDVPFVRAPCRTARTVRADQCSASQPVLKRLYARFRCRCIAARAPGDVACGDRLQHGAVLRDRRRPQRRRVVVMLELLVERAGALLPQHLDDGDQRAVAGSLGDPQMKQPIAAERLPPLRQIALHVFQRLFHRRHLRLLRGFRGQRSAFAFDHVARTQKLERSRRRVSLAAAATPPRPPALRVGPST